MLNAKKCYAAKKETLDCGEETPAAALGSAAYSTRELARAAPEAEIERFKVENPDFKKPDRFGNTATIRSGRYTVTLEMEELGFVDSAEAAGESRKKHYLQ